MMMTMIVSCYFFSMCSIRHKCSEPFQCIKLSTRLPARKMHSIENKFIIRLGKRQHELIMKVLRVHYLCLLGLDREQISNLNLLVCVSQFFIVFSSWTKIEFWTSAILIRYANYRNKIVQLTQCMLKH